MNRQTKILLEFVAAALCVFALYIILYILMFLSVGKIICQPIWWPCIVADAKIHYTGPKIGPAVLTRVMDDGIIEFTQGKLHAVVRGKYEGKYAQDYVDWKNTGIEILRVESYIDFDSQERPRYRIRHICWRKVQ